MLAEGNRNYHLLSVCLAQIEGTWKGFVPGHKVIKAFDKKLAHAERYIHGLAELSGYFYPSLRELVPFVLLIAIATAFNSDTIRSLKWSNVDLHAERAGARAIKIYGEKGRAGRNLVRLLDPDAGSTGEVSLLMLLELLRDSTAIIRQHAPTRHADNLFPYFTNYGRKVIMSLDARGNGDASRAGWRLALNAFIKEYHLSPFVLKQIRPSILDLVQLMGGSLEDARAVGDHRGPATTWTYYTSSTVKKRYRERIGEVLLLRERWVSSAGKIDPRHLLVTDDKGSATPGFLCLDPFDSPRPNQKQGRLCTDYGGCPSCPLAAARPNDATAVSFYRALREAIYSSQQVMNAYTWLNRWAGVLVDLNALIALVPRSVAEESSNIRITLPKVG